MMFKDTVAGKQLLNENLIEIDNDHILQMWDNQKDSINILKLIIDYADSWEMLEASAKYPLDLMIDGIKTDDFGRDDFSQELKDKIKLLNDYFNG